MTTIGFLTEKLNLFVFLLITFPIIQNNIYSFNIQSLKNYLYYRNQFLKYFFAKTIIDYIRKLNSDFDIKNHHIFVLYKYLNKDFVFEFVKTFNVILILNYLKHNDTYYYYFKSFQLAYYYKTKYLFNNIEKNDAKYIINTIIKEKRWNEISKNEIVNAIFVLSNKENFTLNKINIQILKFFSLVSLISCIKFLVSFKVLYILFIICYLLYLLYLLYLYHKTEIDFLHYIIFLFLLLNTNYYIISLYYIFSNIICAFLNDLYFYIINIDDITKIITHYTSDDNDFILI